jgi:hypothetical protein
MADFELEVVGLFRRSDPSAELMRGRGLVRPADIVRIAFDLHQCCAFNGYRVDQTPLRPEVALG